MFVSNRLAIAQNFSFSFPIFFKTQSRLECAFASLIFPENILNLSFAFPNEFYIVSLDVFCRLVLDEWDAR